MAHTHECGPNNCVVPSERNETPRAKRNDVMQWCWPYLFGCGVVPQGCRLVPLEAECEVPRKGFRALLNGCHFRVDYCSRVRDEFIGIDHERLDSPNVALESDVKRAWRKQKLVRDTSKIILERGIESLQRLSTT